MKTVYLEKYYYLCRYEQETIPSYITMRLLSHYMGTIVITLHHR